MEGSDNRIGCLEFIIMVWLSVVFLRWIGLL